jgi:hypothetical protein
VAFGLDIGGVGGTKAVNVCKHAPNNSCCGVPDGVQWWNKEPGYIKEEIKRAQARPNLWVFRNLPNCQGQSCRGSCTAHRGVGWWERPLRTVKAELAYQAKRLSTHDKYKGPEW